MSQGCSGLIVERSLSLAGQPANWQEWSLVRVGLIKAGVLLDCLVQIVEIALEGHTCCKMGGCYDEGSLCKLMGTGWEWWGRSSPQSVLQQPKSG